MKLLAAALFMVVSAAGQAKAAPVVAGTYYEDSATATGNCTTTCTITLSPAPAGKAVYNKSLDCLIQIQAQDFAFISVGVNGRKKYLVATLVGQTGSQRYYALNYYGPFSFRENPPVISYAGNSNSGTVNPFVVGLVCSIIGEVGPKYPE